MERIYVATYGIYTKNGYIMGEEYKEFEGGEDYTLEDAEKDAQDYIEEMENYYPCVMLEEIEESEEEEEEEREQNTLPF